MNPFTTSQMTTRRGSLILALALALAPFAQGAAQALLSTQGFGYPTGQFSARANGTAGAISEMDPLSMVNPAALSLIGTRLVYLQIEPEYRSVSTANGTDRTSLTRFPIVFGAVPIGSDWVISLGSSTLLDRTSEAVFNTTQFLNATDSVPMTTDFKVNGAMDDVRLAAAWAPLHWLRLGVGAHAITGHNLVTITQSFADTTVFAAITQQRILGFSGAAASAGVELVSNLFTAAFSARRGGDLNLNVTDTSLGSARVPAHYGASIAFTGLANSTIAIRTARDDWSALSGLGSPDVVGVNAWDTSVGADIAGPHINNRTVYLRAGYRDRTLPFEASGEQVRERSVSGGVGTTFANGRVLTDFALIRASRTADLPASEHAWTLSFGITVRP